MRKGSTLEKKTTYPRKSESRVSTREEESVKGVEVRPRTPSVEERADHNSKK